MDPVPAKETKSQPSKLDKMSAVVDHQTRMEIWTILVDRESSPSELAEILGKGLSHVSYHCRALREAGVIELTATYPRRGAVEHRYVGVERAVRDQAAVEELPVADQEAYAEFILKLIFTESAMALAAGTFCERPDHAIIRVPQIQLDEEGRAELGAGYHELLERIYDAAARSAERLSTSGEESIPTTAFLSFFEKAPPLVKDSD